MRITGVPAGLGNPVFEKLDAMLSQAVMSIGAVKAVEIGDGIQVAHMNGSEDNDGFTIKDNMINKTSNHAGGIMGGISDGSEIILRAISNQPHLSVSHSKLLPVQAGRFPLRYMADMIRLLSQEQLSLSNP